MKFAANNRPIPEFCKDAQCQKEMDFDWFGNGSVQDWKDLFELSCWLWWELSKLAVWEVVAHEWSQYLFFAPQGDELKRQLGGFIQLFLEITSCGLLWRLSKGMCRWEWEYFIWRKRKCTPVSECKPPRDIHCSEGYQQRLNGTAVKHSKASETHNSTSWGIMLTGGRHNRKIES